MRKVIFVRIHAVIATGIIAISLVAGLPVFSQEAEGETESTEEQSILVESTIVGDVDPAAAITIEDLTIPIDQLELFVKPLTLEELQVEAAAWFLILKDKVQEISQTEIAIKRQNVAIASQEEAAQAVTEAEAALAEAEAALDEASPGTPEHERATEKLEAAKQSLQEANQAVEAAVETGEDLEENEALQATLEEAESEEEITAARQILEEARRERDGLTTGSAAHDDATEKIDALDQALIDLESAEEELEEAVPDSPEYQELSAVVEAARATVIEAAEAISDAGLAPGETAEEGAIESEETESALDEIAADIESAEEQADGDAIETEATEVQADDEVAVATAETAENSGEQLEGVAEELEAVAEAESDLKNQLVVNVTNLQGERIAIVDRFTVVLDALDQKGGDTTSYRKYVEVVSGVELDITDTEGLGVRLVSWLRSEEGGLRWGLNLAKFVGILLASVIVSRLLARVTDRVLTRIGGTSALFRDFAVILVQRGVLVAGALLALASLGVSLGPVLALVGGASFVLAFALQSNLGNFASGLMLLVNKPFDVGDEVKVAGYWAYVDSISLASTKLKDFGGSIITLPNNTVWGSDIINYTHSDIRKLGLAIHIKFSQDLDKVLAMWLEMTASHPEVLENPKPGFFPWNAHYDYYIGVNLTAWSNTDVYWDVYVDLLKSLQQRLDEFGIELAAPQQDINLHQIPAEKLAAQGFSSPPHLPS
ncbi:mechanosensitive ion channel [Leptolyngbya cf. ectocarpi LEGE 11479]|uniref:Mechanosensitive ion channel n=1 Tax=Leptolyngbya cf. ectocarpi LEGE 11479 TaxID=1828722 RepID=A0A928ZYC7_LEPEC|nr:mechanosensitive ion channel domain-containing protein [Leptolyngbya ectocarpi]MBE9069716.1 mechanosensitive ion channel [Leptolyngbya cf. ectocarpi LEGE 11479]